MIAVLAFPLAFLHRFCPHGDNGWDNPVDLMIEEQSMSEVIVLREVLRGLLAVRDSGLTDMLDRPVVARMAKRMGFKATNRWIKAHPREYAEGVFRGFRQEA
jgi:hypothetical protein